MNNEIIVCNCCESENNFIEEDRNIEVAFKVICRKCHSLLKVVYVKEVFERIKKGETFRRFNEFGELRDEFYIDENNLLIQGIFRYNLMPNFIIINSLEGLKDCLNN